MSDQKLASDFVIGFGLTADVHLLNDRHVLKLFHHGLPREDVEREFKATCTVHSAGLPVPAAHEIVVQGGRYGIVFDRIDGISLFRLAQARPWTVFQTVRQLADLHAQVNRCRAPVELPSQRELLIKRIAAGNRLDESQKASLLNRLDELPEGDALCHGDFHFENILMTSRGPVILDWSGAARGVPAADVASTCWLFANADFPKEAAVIPHLILRVVRKMIHRRYVRQYVRSGLATCSQIEAWSSILAAARSERVAMLQTIQDTTRPPFQDQLMDAPGQ